MGVGVDTIEKRVRYTLRDSITLRRSLQKQERNERKSVETEKSSAVGNLMGPR